MLVYIYSHMFTHTFTFADSHIHKNTPYTGIDSLTNPHPHYKIHCHWLDQKNSSLTFSSISAVLAVPAPAVRFLLPTPFSFCKYFCEGVCVYVNDADAFVSVCSAFVSLHCIQPVWMMPKVDWIVYSGKFHLCFVCSFLP